MLQELLKPEAISIDLQSKDKDEVFAEMTEILVKNYSGLDRAEVISALLTREEKMSTGVIPAIAIPHAVYNKIEKPVLAVGISKQGIDFNSLDGKPVHIIFMILFPANDTAISLDVMQRLAYVFRDPDFVKSIMEKSTASQVAQMISFAENNL